MSHSALPHLELDDQKQIDQICLNAENLWKAGERPQLEPFLLDVPKSLQKQLFRELLLLELEYRERQRILESEGDYLRRFPQEAATISEVFQLSKPLRGESDSMIGQRHGRFQFHKELGRGAFGVVYEAWDEELQRFVAVKVPRLPVATSAFDVERLISEARATAQLRHPSILSVHDVLRNDHGQPMLVMEHIDGKSLREHLDQRDLKRDDLIRLIAGVAEAIDYAHQRGFVHRDLDPRNILIDSTGKPVIGDFGLAIHEVKQPELAGESAGSVRYMSPEQVRGESHWLDGRADIWALGVILYEILTGRLPFVGDDIEQIKTEILLRDPKPPRQIDTTVPANLEAVCLKCLAKRAVDRFSTAKDLAETLRSDGSADSPETVPITKSSQHRFDRNLVTIVAACVVVLATFAAVITLPSLSRSFSSHAHTSAPDGNNSLIPSSIVVNEVRLSVWRTIDWKHDQLRGVISPVDTSAVPLFANDKVRLSIAVNRPAYLYVLWIGHGGQLTPLYPWKDGSWELEPAEPVQLQQLQLPGQDQSWPVSAEANGMESIAVIACDQPLLKKMKALRTDLEAQTENSSLEVYWFQNGELVSRRSGDVRAPELLKQSPVQDSVFRNQQRIGKLLSGSGEAWSVLSFPVRPLKIEAPPALSVSYKQSR